MQDDGAGQGEGVQGENVQGEGAQPEGAPQDGVQHEGAQDDGVRDESAQDGAVRDEAVEDEAVEDGAVQDDAVEDDGERRESAEDDGAGQGEAAQDDARPRDDEVRASDAPEGGPQDEGVRDGAERPASVQRDGGRDRGQRGRRAVQYIGVDLAWSEGSDSKPANESGLVVLDEQGVVQEAGWARGLDEVVAWLERVAVPGAVIAVDAPLVITNAMGNRLCESEVARCYGRWQVSANSSNSAMGWQAGVALRQRLEGLGMVYVDGTRRAKAADRSFFECYPYTTLVGMWELGYDDERPRYKRLAPGVPAAEARAARAQACDELLRRVAALPAAEDPLDLRSHPVTAVLLDEPSPVDQVQYKHREDLLDAAICAWTAMIWHRHGDRRTQVLGATAEPDADGHRPTIVAPARPEQRLAARPGRGAAGSAERAGRGGATPSIATALETVRELRALTSTLSTRLDALEKDLRSLRKGGF